MHTIKCVVIGDEDVGKTCMLMSYTTKKFPTDYVPTIHDGHSESLMFDGKPCNLGLFDTIGEEKYDHLRPLSYPQTDVFLVCFSVASPTSFNNVTAKYVPEIMEYSSRGVPFLIVGTQVDMREDVQTIERLAKMGQKPISFEMGQELANDLKAVKYVECSALTLEGVKNVLDEAIAAALHKPSERRPPTMQTIKCVLNGDEDVGKTCMLMSFTTKKFPTDYVPSCHEIYCENLMIDGEPCALELWDTSGDEKYDLLRPLTYPETDVFLVCLSVASPTSFNNVTDKWVPEIMEYSSRGVPFLIVGTQMDLREDAETIERLAKMGQKPISFEMGQKLANELKAYKYVECSALTQEGISNVLDEAISAAQLNKPPEK